MQIFIFDFLKKDSSWVSNGVVEVRTSWFGHHRHDKEKGSSWANPHDKSP